MEIDVEKRASGTGRAPDRRDVLKAAVGAAGIAFASGYLAGCGGGGEGGGKAPIEPLPSTVPPFRCIYNGYLLTVDPEKALDPSSKTDRHRLYVIHAVLIDPATGRIVATYPPFGDGPDAARPAEDVTVLQIAEDPPAPGHTAAELIDLWREQGVPERYLVEEDFLDLQGAVATPGLIDDHFHLTSWSKKVPAEGETFGFWADVSDPRYYVETVTFERKCNRQALWDIVRDASERLAATGDDGIFLHGYWPTGIDDSDGESVPATVYRLDGSTDVDEPDGAYLLNRIGSYPDGLPTNAFDPCAADPAWPAAPATSLAALLVHTSGQGCWFNAPLAEGYNAMQDEHPYGAFTPTAVLDVVQPDPEEPERELALDPMGAGTAELLAFDGDLLLDVVVTGGVPGDPVHVPFAITDSDAGRDVLVGRPLLADVAERAFGHAGASYQVVPFKRYVVSFVSDAVWEAARAWWEITEVEQTFSHGQWDPQKPYDTNWYNGAERGLIQFVRATGGWRPTGYAEHYVMRDMLAAAVVPDPTVEEAMEHRRRVARWCHRHGVTAMNDIMFYRRDSNAFEFDACWGLSYDHRGTDDGFHGGTRPPESVTTGDLGLRLGLYYYLENAGDVTQVLDLARGADGTTDVHRLRPPEGHPESPGWVSWLGWKLQLDGGTGARTLLSNAPQMKDWLGDAFTTRTDGDQPVAFDEHSFGLLTMTNEPEQVFSSRETAALYWLVRESDPDVGSAAGLYVRDWSFVRKGVVTWLDLEATEAELEADLHADLETLSQECAHVELLRVVDPHLDQFADLASKMLALFRQVRSGWERTLAAVVAVWYEKSQVDAGLPAIPSQVACHCIGDGAVDLWVRAVRQLRDDIAVLPATVDELPSWWQAVLPENPDLGAVHRAFQGERFRVEHLLNVSHHVFDLLHGDEGLDVSTQPDGRNVVFSTQPTLCLLDGRAFRTRGFPVGEELWDIPHDDPNFWRGVPAQPRWHHHMPLPLFADHDVPYTLNTDPPAVRDPRPALTVIAAVTRSPVEIDPGTWLDQGTPDGELRPPDFLAGRVFDPFGMTPQTPLNPLRLSVEQALAAMTFWGAYVSGQERDIGVLAGPDEGADGPGRFADLVVWTHNPLAIQGPDGERLEKVGRTLESGAAQVRLDMVNAFIRKFRPARTIVGGRSFYERA